MAFDYISPERRAAARAVLSGMPPSQRRVATMLEVSSMTLKALIDGEGWDVLDFRRVPVRDCYDRLQNEAGGGYEDGLAEYGSGDLGQVEDGQPDAVKAAVVTPAIDMEPSPAGERAARLRDLLLSHSDRIVQRMERGGDIMNRRNIDALGALSKLADRLGEIAEDAAAEQQEKSDEEVAEILARIHERILALAKGLADEMVEQADRAAAGTVTR